MAAGEREQCPYLSRLDGGRCAFFASGHTAHLIPDPGEELPLRESPEDSPDWDPEGIKVRGIASELSEAWDAAARYRDALRHIADHYDAETSATVPADPEKVGLPGPHHWIELSRYIDTVLGPTEKDSA